MSIFMKPTSAAVAMEYSLVLTFSFCLMAAIASPTWKPEGLQSCPNIGAQKDIMLEQVVGDWRLAYLFLAQIDEGLEEDNTCVVTSLTSNNDSQLELSIFIDTLRANHIDRSTIQFPADVLSPGEWNVHTPLTFEGYLHARVIQASDEHMIITFCGPEKDRNVDNEVDGAHSKNTEEEGLDWRSIFESSKRKKRSSKLDYDYLKEAHIWTAILVKHNDVSAMKFVEYAAILMKHGYDITQGELVSFGKCPLHQKHIPQHLM